MNFVLISDSKRCFLKVMYNMAKSSHFPQDKLNILAQIPPEVFELISKEINAQSDLVAMIHGFKK